MLASTLQSASILDSTQILGYIRYNYNNFNSFWSFASKGDPALATQYVYSFYWSTLTLTKIGETPQPDPGNNHELVFTTADFLIGVLIFAAILGNISMVISNMTVERTTFQNRMDAIKGYMVFRKIEGSLENRVIKWFDYLWANKAALDEETISRGNLS